jgi:transcriptional regulator with XRE-family HTH domain
VSAKPTPPKIVPVSDDLRGVFAFRVRTLRVAKGWSQEHLALECGLDRTYVSAIERSRWNVSLGNIEKLAIALGVKPFALLMPIDSSEFAIAIALSKPEDRGQGGLTGPPE